MAAARRWTRWPALAAHVRRCGGAGSVAPERIQVRNSQYLLAEEPAGGPPGKPVQFAAYCIFPSRFHSWLYALFGLVLKVLVKSEVGRNLLKTVRPRALSWIAICRRT